MQHTQRALSSRAPHPTQHTALRPDGTAAPAGRPIEFTHSLPRTVVALRMCSASGGNAAHSLLLCTVCRVGQHSATGCSAPPSVAVRPRCSRRDPAAISMVKLARDKLAARRVTCASSGFVTAADRAALEASTVHAASYAAAEAAAAAAPAAPAAAAPTDAVTAAAAPAAAASAAMLPVQPKRPRSPCAASAAEPASKRAHAGASAAASGLLKVRMPAALIARVSDFYLSLPEAAALSRTCRTAFMAFKSSQTFKGREEVLSDPPLFNDPRLAVLAVWKSKGGLLLLGKKSRDPHSRAVTVEQLRLVDAALAAAEATALSGNHSEAQKAAALAARAAPPAPALSPRIELLCDLSRLVYSGRIRRSVLELFAFDLLHLSRFESFTNHLHLLLHPQVEQVVRSGWLSEDVLFKLHNTAADDQTFSSLRHLTVLQFLIHPHQNPAMDHPGRLTDLANRFLPLTATCVDSIASVRFILLQSVLADADELRRGGSGDFTVAAMVKHFYAWARCSGLHRGLTVRRKCICECSCGSLYISLCKCCKGCMKRQIEDFEAAVAALAPDFIGSPPSATDIAKKRDPFGQDIRR